MAQKIVGRKAEIRELTDLYNSKRPEFVVVQGRRRVGKTFLVRELFDDKMAFYHTGLSPAEQSDDYKSVVKLQLSNFYSSLKRYGYDGAKPTTWLEAFDMLIELLENRDDNKRQVVFIDELPWMDTPRSNFVSAVEHFWNGWGAGRTNLMFIVCGSATSWLNDKIINNKGGLYNRATAEIVLNPFTLGECHEMYEDLGIAMDNYDQMQAYMITGGIPYYIGMMDRHLSLAQNVDNLFFSDRAKLGKEYDRLFSSLFTNPKTYTAVVDFLAKKREGFTRKEISEHTEIPYGGGLTTILKALEVSNFINSYVPFGCSSRETRYRLTDPLCLFHAYFLSKNKTTDTNFWQNNLHSPQLNAWRGFAFENICSLHIKQIKQALDIGGVSTECSPWRSKTHTPGAQIDLVINRADHVINLCEMKFCSDDFTIDKAYDATLRNKINAFQTETKCRSSIHLTIVTTYGLVRNEYSGRIQNVVTMDDLFK